MTGLGQSEAWGAPRSKVVTWYDHAATVAGGAGLSGLEFMRALMDGTIPPPRYDYAKKMAESMVCVQPLIRQADWLFRRPCGIGWAWGPARWT